MCTYIAGDERPDTRLTNQTLSTGLPSPRASLGGLGDFPRGGQHALDAPIPSEYGIRTADV